MGKLVLLYVLALKVTVSENQLAKLNEEILYGNTVICIDVLFLVAFFMVLFVYIIIVLLNIELKPLDEEIKDIQI